IAHEPVARPAPVRRGRRWPRPRPSPINARRRLAGWGLALPGVALLTLILATLRASVGLPTVLLLFLALVVTTAVVGGRAPAFVAAGAGSLSANWYFTPPLHQLTIADPENLVALVVFLGVAAAVSNFVLAALAATTRADDPLPVLVEGLQSAFGLDAVAVLCREDGEWRVEAAAGSPIPADPAEAT